MQGACSGGGDRCGSCRVCILFEHVQSLQRQVNGLKAVLNVGGFTPADWNSPLCVPLLPTSAPDSIASDDTVMAVCDPMDDTSSDTTISDATVCGFCPHRRTFHQEPHPLCLLFNDHKERYDAHLLSTIASVSSEPVQPDAPVDQ